MGTNINIIKRQFSFITILIILSSVTFINTLPNDFVYDDLKVVLRDSSIRSFSNLPNILMSPRMLRTFSFMVDYQIWGLNPLGYHLTNVLLHILATISIYILFAKIFSNNKVPFITAMIFAVHPVHTDAVSAIANRKDILAMIFFIWSFFFYIIKNRSLVFYFLSIVSFVLAIAAKDMAVIMLPLMLLIYDIYFPKGNVWDFIKSNIWYYIPFCTIYIFLSYLFITLLKSSMLISYTKELFFSSFENFYTALKALIIYMRLLFFPINLNPHYLLPGSQSILEWFVLVGLVSLIVFIIIMIKTFQLSKTISFGMMWLFVTIFPLSNLMIKTTPFFVAERYLYIPSAGFCLIIATLIDKIFKTTKRAEVITKQQRILLIITIFLLSTLSIKRNTIWSDSITLWSDAVNKSTHDFSVMLNLGFSYIKEKDYRRAINITKKAINIMSGEGKAYNNIGVGYAYIKMYNKSVWYFKKAIELDSKYVDALYNLAQVYYKKKLFKKAEEYFLKTLAVNKSHLKSLQTLRLIYLQQRQVKIPKGNSFF